MSRFRDANYNPERRGKTRCLFKKKFFLSYIKYRIYFFSRERFRSVSRSAKVIPRDRQLSVFLRRSLPGRDRLTLRVLAFRKSMRTDLGRPRYYDSKRSLSISFPYFLFPLLRRNASSTGVRRDSIFFSRGETREGRNMLQKLARTLDLSLGIKGSNLNLTPC